MVSATGGSRTSPRLNLRNKSRLGWLPSVTSVMPILRKLPGRTAPSMKRRTRWMVVGGGLFSFHQPLDFLAQAAQHARLGDEHRINGQAQFGSDFFRFPSFQ